LEGVAKGNDEYLVNVVFLVAKVFDHFFFTDPVNDEHDSEKVVPIPFSVAVEFDDRMEYVEEFRKFRDEPDFFREFAYNRMTMVFAMVDASSGKIDFSNVRSSRLFRQHDAPVNEADDGVSTRTYGSEDRNHSGIS
jgi:hypothetical protein